LIDGNFSFIENVFPNYKPAEINSLAQIKSVIPNKLPVPSDKPSVDEIYNKFVKEKKSNSYMYNPPLTLEKITSPLLGKPLAYLNNNEKGLIEKMTVQEEPKIQTQLNEKDFECINHILQSEKCKDVLIKSLNLKESKYKTNNTIEFLAFVLIGIFLIYLLR
jgi:hypothetical protein